MDLTAEALLEIVRDLRSDKDVDQHKRRRLPRVGVRLRLMILPCLSGGATPTGAPSGMTPIVVRLRNLSRRGLGFVSNYPLQKGRPIVVILPRERGGTVHLMGSVERCQPLDDGQFDIGASLRLDTPKEEIDFHIQAALSPLKRTA